MPLGIIGCRKAWCELQTGKRSSILPAAQIRLTVAAKQHDLVRRQSRLTLKRVFQAAAPAAAKRLLLSAAIGCLKRSLLCDRNLEKQASCASARIRPGVGLAGWRMRTRGFFLGKSAANAICIAPTPSTTTVCKSSSPRLRRVASEHQASNSAARIPDVGLADSRFKTCNCILSNGTAFTSFTMHQPRNPPRSAAVWPTVSAE